MGIGGSASGGGGGCGGGGRGVVDRVVVPVLGCRWWMQAVALVEVVTPSTLVELGWAFLLAMM